MHVTLQTHSASHLKFAGTGENGKPKVAIGKASYALTELDDFIQRNDVEIVGIGTNAQEFAQILE
jgi:hypothetical protein